MVRFMAAKSDVLVVTVSQRCLWRLVLGHENISEVEKKRPDCSAYTSVGSASPSPVSYTHVWADAQLWDKKFVVVGHVINVM